MDVTARTPVVNGHSVEIGAATWNKNETSVRNRYVTANGGFSPRSSSEIPVGDLTRIIEWVAEHDELSVRDCAAIINALAASVQRQSASESNAIRGEVPASPMVERREWSDSLREQTLEALDNSLPLPDGKLHIKKYLRRIWYVRPVGTY